VCRADNLATFISWNLGTLASCIGIALPLSYVMVNPLLAELNPICHLLALLGAHHILHISMIRVKLSLLTDCDVKAVPLFTCYFIGWAGLTSHCDCWILENHWPKDTTSHPIRFELFSLCFTSWYDVVCTYRMWQRNNKYDASAPVGWDSKKSGKMGNDYRTNTDLPRMNKWQFEWMPECDFS
jgi:hypothetical protein